MSMPLSLTPTITLETINLDAETHEALDAFADHHDLGDPGPRLERTEAFGVTESVMIDLVEYARTKARAMRLRSAGHVLRAGVEESRCEAIYARLPEDVRW